eukprot:scaffold334_cov241-Pinguiococcus_pyrenoidosus.AAC.39
MARKPHHEGTRPKAKPYPAVLEQEPLALVGRLRVLSLGVVHRRQAQLVELVLAVETLVRLAELLLLARPMRRVHENAVLELTLAAALGMPESLRILLQVKQADGQVQLRVVLQLLVERQQVREGLHGAVVLGGVQRAPAQPPQVLLLITGLRLELEVQKRHRAGKVAILCRGVTTDFGVWLSTPQNSEAAPRESRPAPAGSAARSGCEPSGCDAATWGS